jgi:menaquinone-dependent protoporphyrinogen oxidase
MPEQVLVTYVTKHGSTAEVAGAVAKTLEGAEVSVVLREAGSVQGLGEYRALVFGAPLYAGRMLRAGRRFLTRHLEELAVIPLAVFALGPLGSEGKEWEVPQREFERALASYPSIHPLSTALFGGVIDQSKLGFPERFAPPLKRYFPLTDVRDWTAIDEWASSLPALLNLI